MIGAEYGKEIFGSSWFTGGYKSSHLAMFSRGDRSCNGSGNSGRFRCFV